MWILPRILIIYPFKSDNSDCFCHWIQYKMCRFQVIILHVSETKLCWKKQSWSSNHAVLNYFYLCYQNSLVPKPAPESKKLDYESQLWFKKFQNFSGCFFRFVGFVVVVVFLVLEFFSFFWCVLFCCFFGQWNKSWLQGGEVKYRYLSPI